MQKMYCLCLSRIGEHQGTVTLIHSSHIRAEKTLAPGVIDIFVIPSGLVLTSLEAHNGSTHGHVFVTFKHRLFTKRTRNRVKNGSVCAHFIPVLSTGPMTLLRFGSALQFCFISLAALMSIFFRGGCEGCGWGGGGRGRRFIIGVFVCI